MGNEIDEDLDTSLAAAVEAVPERTSLIDPDAGYCFLIRAIPTNGLRFWIIDRYDQKSLDAALTDLNLGVRATIVPYTEFVYGCRRIAVLHKADTLEPGDDLPNIVDQPHVEPHQQRQLLQFLTEAGLTRVSRSEVQQLVIQLGRLQILRPR
ncbi:MAG: hypothetical protein ACRDP6_32345 [Actinoallomurus sp.]